MGINERCPHAAPALDHGGGWWCGRCQGRGCLAGGEREAPNRHKAGTGEGLPCAAGETLGRTGKAAPRGAQLRIGGAAATGSGSAAKLAQGAGPWGRLGRPLALGESCEVEIACWGVARWCPGVMGGRNTVAYQWQCEGYQPVNGQVVANDWFYAHARPIVDRAAGDGVDCGAETVSDSADSRCSSPNSDSADSEKSGLGGVVPPGAAAETAPGAAALPEVAAETAAGTEPGTAAGTELGTGADCDDDFESEMGVDPFSDSWELTERGWVPSASVGAGSLPPPGVVEYSEAVEPEYRLRVPYSSKLGPGFWCECGPYWSKGREYYRYRWGRGGRTLGTFHLPGGALSVPRQQGRAIALWRGIYLAGWSHEQALAQLRQWRGR